MGNIRRDFSAERVDVHSTTTCRLVASNQILDVANQEQDLNVWNKLCVLLLDSNNY